MIVSGGFIFRLRSRGNLSEILLIAADIILKGRHETLGMLRREDDSRTDLGPWRLRLYEDKIDDKFRLVMIDHGQVDIGALGHIFIKLNLQLELLFFLLFQWNLPFLARVIMPRPALRLTVINPGLFSS